MLQCLTALQPGLAIELFTTVPQWFFHESLRSPFRYHRLVTDVGLVQQDPLQEDLPATVQKLHELLRRPEPSVQQLARQVQDLGCQLVLCDISPLGLAVAAAAGLPGVLVESFTWDWIYRAYLDDCPALAPIIEQLAGLVAGHTTLHLQAEPCCQPLPGTAMVPPISRTPRLSRQQLRQGLGIPEQARLVLLTMGGIPWQHHCLDLLEAHGASIVLPGAADQAQWRGRLLLLPHRSDFYHPDLVAASDLVIGKLGYSTVAEVYHAGAAFAFIARSRFPESPVLAAFARRELAATEIAEAAFRSGAWVEQLDHLLAALPYGPPGADTDGRTNGAAAAAALIAALLPS